MNLFRSLRSWNFRVFFAGVLVSNFGVWMQRTAQDWIVLTELSDQDAFALGVLTALQFGPQVFLTAAGGLLAERLDRRKFLMLTQSVMAVLAIGLAVVTLTGYLTYPVLCGFALALGIVAALDLPARQSFVTQLVKPSNISNAVSLTSAGFNFARLAGPGVAGLMLAFVGAGWVFAVNAVTFSSVVIIIALVRPSLVRPINRGVARIRMSATVRSMWLRPDLRFILISIFLFGALGWNFPVFITTMANIEFGEGAFTFGVLTSCLGVGAFAGGMFIASRQRVRLRAVAFSAGGVAIAATACAFSPSVGVFGIALVLFGAAASVLSTSSNAYLQTTTLDEMRGRAIALYWSIFIGSSVVGAPVAGWVANELGPRWALGLAVLGGVLIVALTFVSFTRRDGMWGPRRSTD